LRGRGARLCDALSASINIFVASERSPTSHCWEALITAAARVASAAKCSVSAVCVAVVNRSVSITSLFCSMFGGICSIRPHLVGVGDLSVEIKGMCTECVGNSILEIVDSSCGEGMFGLVRRSSILKPCSVFHAKQVPARRIPSEYPRKPEAVNMTLCRLSPLVRGSSRSPKRAPLKSPPTIVRFPCCVVECMIVFRMRDASILSS